MERSGRVLAKWRFCSFLNPKEKSGIHCKGFDYTFQATDAWIYLLDLKFVFDTVDLEILISGPEQWVGHHRVSPQMV